MNYKASFSTPVNTSVDRLWAILKDKAVNPGRYVPGFISTEVLERNEDYFLCRLQTDRFDITERISIDEASHTVNFDVLDHPHYTGLLVNRIEKALSVDGLPVLTYACDWKKQAGVGETDDMADIIQGALERTRQIAEKPA